MAIQAEVAGLPAQTKRQDYVIAKLRHVLYGKRSAQLDPDARQLAFENLETAVAEAKAARDALTVRNADGTTRRPAPQRKLGHLPDHPLPGNRMLAFDERGPRIEQVIEPEQRVWPCGCTDMVKPPFRGLPATHAGQSARTVPNGRTSSQPAFRSSAARQRMFTCARGVTVRPNYACRRCDLGVLQADTLHWLLEGGLPTEGTLAHVAVSKYADHLPLYRQCQIYGRGGVNLDRSTLARWCGTTACHLAPVVDRMLAHLKRSNRLFMDETRAPVLDPGAGKTKTGYLWPLTRDDRGWGGGDLPAVVFTYAPGRHGSHAMGILRGFEGVLQVPSLGLQANHCRAMDGYTGYDPFAEPKAGGRRAFDHGLLLGPHMEQTA